MTFSMIVRPMLEAQEKARAEGGAKAEKECINSQVGALIGAGGGMATGAALGSIIPVVGTVAGGFIGGLIGCIRGGRNKTVSDNVMSAAGLAATQITRGGR